MTRRPPYPRTRERNSKRSVYHTRTVISADGTPTTSDAGISTLGVREVVDDVVTPGFRAISKQGGIVNNPFMKMRETFSVQSTGYAHKYVGTRPVLPADAAKPIEDSFQNILAWKLGPAPSRWNHVTRQLTLSLYNDSDISRMVTLASTKALSNYNKSYAQGFVSLGELHKTLAMLRNPLQAIITYLRKPYRYNVVQTSYLKGKGKVVKQTTRTVDPVASIIPLGNAAAGQYLAWYYGIKPLMREVDNIREAFNKALKIRERTSGVEESTRTSVVDQVLHNGSALLSCNYRTTTKESLTVEGGLLFQPTEMTYLDALGLSPSAIPSAIFDLTPWSFTTSWVSNLGTWIDTLAVTFSKDIRAQWVKITSRIEVKREAIPSSFITHPSWAITTASSDGDLYVAEETYRYPANLVDLRGLVWTLNSDSIPRLAAASLLIQKLTGIKSVGRSSIQKGQQ